MTMDVCQLQVAFQSKHETRVAVESSSFVLNPGETLALLGESGCGKSLTALALMRLLPQSCVYGRQSAVLLNNEDILNMPDYLMRLLRGRRIAMIFQEPMTALNPVLRIDKQLKEALSSDIHRSSSAVKEELIALLYKVEISEPEQCLYKYPHQLSGGQKQRVMIAMALANHPDILIADEPTTALDVTVQAQILLLLKKLQKEYNMSMLLITHDLGVVKAVADRVCVMYAGELVESALVDAFFTEVKHPYSQQLMASLPTFAKRHTYLSVIPGAVPSLDAIPSGCRFHPRCAYAFTPCQSIHPQWQTSGAHGVRCHLYPEAQGLAPLHTTTEHREAFAGESPLLLSVNALRVNFTLGRNFFKRGDIIKAVDDVSFSLYQGKTLALVGESGSGKTTIAHAILRLQPSISGNIQYEGKNVAGLTGRALREYRKRVQIIFQDPYSAMNPRLTVREILAEGMIAAGLKSRAIAERQAILLDQVNLPLSSLSRYPHQFSGGQRQRICIARALAMDPAILICDEPTSALDVSVQAQVLNLLKTLQKEWGIAYLIITHNMAVVAYMADEVIVLQKGKIVERGNSEQILHAPKEAYTKQLIASVLTI